MVRRSFLLFLLLSLAAGPYLHAQDVEVNCDDSLFCVPGVIGMPRSKAIILEQERVFDYGIRSNAERSDLNDGRGEVRYNRRWDLRLRAPIVIRPGLTIAAGVRYFVEEYRFDDLAQDDYSLYRNLEDKPLRNLGASIYVIKPFRGNRYFLFRGTANLNGDYNSDELPTSDFLRWSASPLYGIKRNERTSMAFGAAFAYTFGRAAVYPVVAYNRTFNEKWGLEALLPANAKIRYTHNERNLFYGKVELQGASYNIQLADSVLGQSNSLHLNKSEIRYMLTYEREIYDFLWFGVETGVRSNINFNLNDARGVNRDLLIRNRLNEALVFNVSLFIVPPRKLLE